MAIPRALKSWARFGPPTENLTIGRCLSPPKIATSPERFFNATQLQRVANLRQREPLGGVAIWCTHACQFGIIDNPNDRFASGLVIPISADQKKIFSPFFSQVYGIL